MNRKQKKNLYRIIAAAVLLVILHLVSHIGEQAGVFSPDSYGSRIILLFMYMVPYIVIGYDILKKALKGVINRQPLDENLLMSIATLGAFALAVYRTGDFDEAVAVMLFYQVGELFQSYALGKSRKNIGELMDIRPDYANIEGPDGLEKVDPDEVEPGSIIVVQPGEKVPIDGVVVQGRAHIDNSALTGESVPVSVGEGDEILSGCIDTNGLLKIRTTREFDQSTASKILDMVENASSRKARSEQFITRFARVYTPAVVLSAVALALLPPLVAFLTGNEPQWGEWIYRALTFLVISCPCALVISIPLSFFAGIGGASREGILVKGSNYLEALSKVRILVADKTGTLTKGRFEVSDLIPAGPRSVVQADSGAGPRAALQADSGAGSQAEPGRILYLAACAERHSSHPIAEAIVKAATLPESKWSSEGKTPMDAKVEDLSEKAGRGLCAMVDGTRVCVGNLEHMKDNGIDFAENATEDSEDPNLGTPVYVGVDGEPAGIIMIADSIKDGAQDAINALKKTGIKRIIMLTGDGREAAEKVAAKLGISEVYSRLLPEDKVNILEDIIAGSRSHGSKDKDLVAFAGDGINDAPVLSRADVGIAMGALGSDAAIEAADVVLMDDDPGKIARAIAISGKCMTIVRENIVFAIGIKVLCLLLCAVGLAGMWLAIFADVGVMVLAVLNSIRTLFVKKT